tara:strand:+ start:1817 stop:2527 length:711 start_codon:yes stop_codon:yes gene_type:complete
MIKKIFSIITLATITLFPHVNAMDLDGFYITPKVGYSATEKSGQMSYTSNGGNVLPQKSVKLGTSNPYGVSIGKYVKDNIRFELEAMKRDNYSLVAYRISDPSLTTRSDLNSTALFLNSFYEFEPLSISNKSFIPYLGGGIGSSSNKTETLKRSNGQTVSGTSMEEFAYKLSAGTLFSLKEKLSLDIAYQYVNLGEFQSGVEVYNAAGVRQGDLQKAYHGGEIESHEIMIGLQFKF